MLLKKWRRCTHKMTNPHDIVIRPIVTEQSMADMADKKYTFVVQKGANKTEIKKAVESIFGVDVEKVNTLNYDGKVKRMWRRYIIGNCLFLWNITKEKFTS